LLLTNAFMGRLASVVRNRLAPDLLGHAPAA